MSEGIVWAGGVYIGTAGADPGKTNKIGECKDFSYNHDVDMIEMTNRDSSGHKVYLPGLDGAKVSVTANYLKVDAAGQQALRTAFYAKTKIALRVNMDDGSNNGYGVYGDGYVASMPITSSVGGEVSTSFNFQFSGAVTPDDDAAP